MANDISLDDQLSGREAAFTACRDRVSATYEHRPYHSFIRDKIYDELLIVRRTPEDEEKYDKIQAGLKKGTHEYELERELDFMLQDYALIPDSSVPNHGMKFIGKNKGILLACKQIYEEATTTLFGKNIFAACPQSERVCSFWRCSIYCGCVPKDRPCLHPKRRGLQGL
ncbi:uncharacterized protein MYCFIDRAFT_195652 [Pseudocercospora fijiensis CIRAD86]|uniref:Uncharacterized protein n=1 Tax=Pseudocercospora fijiensis (strain CIRAD86) TaxID=383855 RepID=M3B5M9_PSEFD|nr:uncharacterized protein MYCFIDRAFT_195652 [Pseudocercospora fijiensis CIRAD86]EME84667.1 hypothetical protein MYCFIDRAFT_195652 [Pseudocercospora fijiensis CIRAD86]